MRRKSSRLNKDLFQMRTSTLKNAKAKRAWLKFSPSLSLSESVQCCFAVGSQFRMIPHWQKQGGWEM
jgi:hypothetical protein